MTVAGLILAGGRGSRLGGGKAFAPLAGRPLVDHVIARFAPQVDSLYLNGDGDPRWRDYPYPLVPDEGEDHAGPLAGLFSFCRYSASRQLPWRAVALVPCDGPFVPAGLVAALKAKLEETDADLVCIRWGGELQPTFSLWRRRTSGAVTQAFSGEGRGGFKTLIRELDAAILEWPAADGEPFFNINTQADLQRAEAML